MKYFLYKTTNIVNNNYYIGVHSTENIDDNYLGSGVALNKAIKKYGRNNFIREILVHCDSIDEAYALEEMIVTPELVKKYECYNACVGGRGGVAKSMPIEKRIENGKKSGKKAREEGLGIFALSDEDKIKYSTIGGKSSGKLAVERGHGIHSQTPEERLELSKLGGKITADMYRGSKVYNDGTNYFRYSSQEQEKMTFENFLLENPQFSKGMALCHNRHKRNK